MTNSTVGNIINILNTYPTNMLLVQRFMLLARIQRAAKLGDTEARRFVTLCELNIETVMKH